MPNSATTAALTAGSYSYIGVYSGDSNYTGFTTGPETLTINQATPTVTLTDNGGVYNGSAFPATATETGIAGIAFPTSEGSLLTLTFYSGNYTLAQLTGNSPPSAPAAPSAIGNYTVLASFTSTADYTTAAASTTFSITNEVWVDQAWTASPSPIDHSSISTSVIPADVTLVYGVNAFSTVQGGVTGVENAYTASGIRLSAPSTSCQARMPRASRSARRSHCWVPKRDRIPRCAVDLASLGNDNPTVESVITAPSSGTPGSLKLVSVRRE